MRAMSRSLGVLLLARRPVVSLGPLLSLASLLSLAACGSGPTEGPKPVDPGLAVGGVPGSTTSRPLVEKSAAPTERTRPRATPPSEERRRPADDEHAAPAAPLAEAGPDPMSGAFSLAQATSGMPTTGALIATIKTSKGELHCKLLEDKAPIAVANFVGLARGTRPFKDKGAWVTRAAYDGTTFHRVIKGFMVQGGDPQGTGRGEPGYVFKDELWTGMGSKHDRPGLLCMANRGPDTNGMQFFITDASAPHLDRSYTIFGECNPVSVVHAIANVPTEAGDRPQQEVTIDKVEITRGGAAGSLPGAKAPAAAKPAAAPATPEGAPPAGAAPAGATPAGTPAAAPVPADKP
jgi:peptidyl-prolyl cis-trans isomerase A (cyclophilin A)